jgi:hypothetical protein
VTERVGCAVEAGRLAVPHAEHTVVLGAGQLAGELAAPGGGGAELLVEAGYVVDQVPLEQLAVARELEIEPAERRALVAGDHRAGGEAAPPVGAVLVEQEPHERLHAGDQDAALFEHVFVVEADLAQHATAAVAVGLAHAARAPPARLPSRSRPLKGAAAAPRQCRLPRHW